jgi:hypothetical protein
MSNEVVLIEKELSYTIMQAAFEVHNTLGPGFPEKIYEEAMARELSTRGVEIERQALSYLKATGLELAIVINFGAERVQSSRVVYTKGKAKLSPRLPRPNLSHGEE